MTGPAHREPIQLFAECDRRALFSFDAHGIGEGLVRDCREDPFPLFFQRRGDLRVGGLGRQTFHANLYYIQFTKGGQSLPVFVLRRLQVFLLEFSGDDEGDIQHEGTSVSRIRFRGATSRRQSSPTFAPPVSSMEAVVW